MGTLSWIYPPPVAHVNGWAECTWELPLSKGFGEVSGVGRCIHFYLGVCDPRRGNEKNLTFLLWEGVAWYSATVWRFTASRLLDALTVNPGGLKPSGPESCGVLDLYHCSDLPSILELGSCFTTCIWLEIELSPLAQSDDFPMLWQPLPCTVLTEEIAGVFWNESLVDSFFSPSTHWCPAVGCSPHMVFQWLLLSGSRREVYACQTQWLGRRDPDPCLSGSCSVVLAVHTMVRGLAHLHMCTASSKPVVCLAGNLNFCSSRLCCNQDLWPETWIIWLTYTEKCQG